jgi:hypothetical protein
MGESTLREYTIRVELTVVFHGDVVVTAANDVAACELAIEEFQCDWSESESVRATTRVLSMEAP